MNLFKEFKFKLRAKAEVYQDEQKIRMTATDAIPVDYVDGSREMLELIAELKKRI